MAKPITPFSITAPGFLGLNLSDSPVDMPDNFALQAMNCIIDRAGRVASRNGWEKAHTSNVDLSTSDIECIGELIQNDGTATVVAAGGGFLFTHSGTTLTTLTYGGGGSAPVISANNWKFCQINGVAMFWQRGYDPLIYDPAVSTTQFRRLSEKASSAGTVQQANEAISAYGRVWCADLSTDKQTVYWSDLLTPHIWTGGSSGSLNLLNVWPSGGDEITALAAHNNFLFIFGKKQTLIYQGADDPSKMTMKDSIVGIGCITRDSVQVVGEDVWFLSSSGLRSIMRTIQEQSSPVRTISKNIHTQLQAYVTPGATASIKAGYSPVNSFYLLHIPTSGKTFCFDTRSMLEDGSARVTEWNGISPSCMFETSQRKFYIGKAGYIGEYAGYNDDSSYFRVKYYTSWLDFGNPIQTSILKRILLTMIGGTNQAIIFKWAYDFSPSYFSQTATISSYSQSSEYGIAEYGEGEYGSYGYVNTLSVSGQSAGRVLQFGFEANINGNPISIQRIDLFTKDGRL